jgi:hypothetical protein
MIQVSSESTRPLRSRLAVISVIISIAFSALFVVLAVDAASREMVSSATVVLTK